MNNFIVDTSSTNFGSYFPSETPFPGPNPEHTQVSEEDERLGIHPKFLLPHEQTFAAIFQAGLNVYFSRFDEALRNNYPDDYLAFRRDGSIHSLLRHRQLPVATLPYHVEVDNPKDPRQKEVSERLTKLVERIPRFSAMRLYLDEDVFYGKYGSQVVWDRVKVDGEHGITIVDHIPINGDKIVYRFDGTPGIMIHKGYSDPYANRYVFPADQGMALFLYDPFFRDRFIISEFEPNDTDFLFESDMSAAVRGYGLRGRLYWTWFLRTEVLAWKLDALQRIGANGMIAGYFPDGDWKAEQAITRSLINLMRNNVAAFPRRPNDKNSTIWEHVEPSRVAYDILMNLIKYFDETIKLAIVGQVLSTEARATGIGSGAAELHGYTLENIINYDAGRQSEVLTEQLLKPMIKFNYGELPFNCRLVITAKVAESKEKMDSAKTLHEMNVPLDSEELYEASGFTPPKEDSNIVPGKLDLQAKMQKEQQAQQMAQGSPPGGSPAPLVESNAASVAGKALGSDGASSVSGWAPEKLSKMVQGSSKASAFHGNVPKVDFAKAARGMKRLVNMNVKIPNGVKAGGLKKAAAGAAKIAEKVKANGFPL